LIIKFSGAEYEYDPAKIDVATAMTIRDHTGMGIRSWEKAIDDADPLALQALFWVVLKQNGERRTLKTLDFSVVEFYQAIVEASKQELVDKLTALTAAGMATDGQRRALAVISGEETADEGEEINPTETAS